MFWLKTHLADGVGSMRSTSCGGGLLFGSGRICCTIRTDVDRENCLAKDCWERRAPLWRLEDKRKFFGTFRRSGKEQRALSPFLRRPLLITRRFLLASQILQRHLLWTRTSLSQSRRLGFQLQYALCLIRPLGCWRFLLHQRHWYPSSVFAAATIAATSASLSSASIVICFSRWISRKAWTVCGWRSKIRFFNASWKSAKN